jgi:hypothetical protein
MKSLPESYDYDAELKWYIASLALGFGRDYQDFAPLPGHGIGTATEGEILHMKARGKGPAAFMSMIEEAFNYRGVMPRTVTFSFDQLDIVQEQSEAQARKTRAESIEIWVNSGVITPQVARQIMLDDGDLKLEYVKSMGEEDITPTVPLGSGEKPDETEEDVVPMATPEEGEIVEMARKGGEPARFFRKIKEIIETKLKVASLDTSKTRFRSAIRALVRGAISGEIVIDSFINQLQIAIETWFPKAFMAGMAACGVIVDSVDDMGQNERASLYGDMSTDLMSAANFGRDIGAARYGIVGSPDYVKRGARAAVFNPLYVRADLYTTRLDHFYTLGQRFGCADRMMTWRLGRTKEHCMDCSYYDGQTHRMNTWEKYGAIPRSHSLECGGWNCDCQLSPAVGRAYGRLRSPSGGGLFG